MDRIRASSKTISLRNWRRPSAAAAAAVPLADSSISQADVVPRPKTSRYRTDGSLILNPLVGDDGAIDQTHQRLLPIPEGPCIVLKYLVDFLLKNKLHKNDLFLLDAKPSETTRLLRNVHDGELPERLSQYSSRSVSFVILHTITHTYAPLLPRNCLPELLRLMQQEVSVDTRVAFVAQVVHWQLSAEQRALFESLLILLNRLSLKATATMNAVSLGDLVASKLVANNGVAATTSPVAELLIKHAWEIVHKRQTLACSHAVVVSPVSDRDLTYNLSRESNAVALHSAAKIISRGSDAGQNDGRNSTAPVHANGKIALDQEAARRVSLVFGAILESPQSKHGLFTEQVRLRNSTLMTFLCGAPRSINVSSFHVRELAAGVAGYLKDTVTPLLDGFNAPTSKALEFPSVAVDCEKKDATVTMLRMFILHELAPFVQDVLLLLLAAVRLALDAGTDMELLITAATPWIFNNIGGSSAESMCRILFSDMHCVLQPLLAKRARVTLVRPLMVIFRIAFWVARCRLRSIQSRHRRTSALRPWSEAIASSLCGVVERLIEQTRAYPSQHRRLYLDGGNDMELSILVEKLSIGSGGTTDEIYFPHSAALAVRRVLTTVFRPLGAETEETIASQTRLMQLLLTHLDLLLRHEGLASVRCKLKNAFDEMLLHEVVTHLENDIDELSLRKATPQAEDKHDDHPSGHDTREGEFDMSELESADDCHRVADTLSEWLASTGDGGGSSGELPQHSSNLLPPLGFTLDALQLLQDRQNDMCFVLQHCFARMETNQNALPDQRDANTRLFTLVGSLRIPPVLLPRQRAARTLDRIQNRNRGNKVSMTLVGTSQLEDFEIVETLVLETIATLRHPSLAPLYPSIVDQLGVLLDVWGLADRSVVLSHDDAPPENL